MQRSVFRSVPVLVAGGLLAVIVVAALQYQAIYDWSRLRNYDPPAAIEQLAIDTTMNDDARRLFYVNHPELNDRSTFRTNCTGFDNDANVLGCFQPLKGIFIFDVTDERLHGVEQVTAAHELLHAAYARLNPNERREIDTLVEQAATKIDDPRVKSTIDNYRSRDASVLPDELHSIVGTTVKDLPPALETYYKKYFTNRAQIVQFYVTYESAFTELQNRAEALKREIEGIEQEAKLLSTTLEAENDRLERDRKSVNTQAEVDAYNHRVNTYNAQIKEYNALVDRYGALINEYNNIAIEEQGLNNSLNSMPAL